jgi:hypothetical protein
VMMLLMTRIFPHVVNPIGALGLCRYRLQSRSWL